MAKSKEKNPLEDYRSMNDDILADRIDETVMRLKKLKFSHAVNPIENPMSIRVARRMVARLKTEQHKRDLEA